VDFGGVETFFLLSVKVSTPRSHTRKRTLVFCVSLFLFVYVPLYADPSVRRWSAAARLLGLRVRIPPGAWMFVLRVLCVCEVEVSATS
jgi:hypothetical protein